MPKLVDLSPLDTDRFCIICARANLADPRDIQQVMQFCVENHVKLLIARCSADNIPTVHVMEELGFRLMDTLVYLRCDLETTEIPGLHSGAVIRELESSDIPQVIEIAHTAFKDYKGHYHTDLRLDPVKVNEVYSSWAERCCIDKNAADCVYVASAGEQILGFRAVRLNSPIQGEFVLAGVHADARNQGIYHDFIVEGLRWCRDKGAKEVINSTLLINTAVQKACIKLGFDLTHSFHTFHKWFD